MSRKVRTRALMLMLLPSLVSISGCMTSSANSGCAVFALIHPDPNFEKRWTVDEKRAVLAHDAAYQAVCGGAR